MLPPSGCARHAQPGEAVWLPRFTGNDVNLSLRPPSFARLVFDSSSLFHAHQSL